MLSFSASLLVTVIFTIFGKGAAQYTNQGKCVESLPPFYEPTIQWHADQSKWYHVAESQKTAQMTASWHASGTPSDACLINNPCLWGHLTADPSAWDVVSCNNVSLHRMYVTVPGFGYNMTYKGRDGNVLRTSMMREAMTDKQSYKMLHECFDDGTKGFAVYGIHRSLDLETYKKINDRLDADGFCRLERVRSFIDETCPT